MSINDKLNQLKEIKGNIKTAIIEKGVEVSDTDSFNSYADKIKAIPTEGGDPYYEELYNLRTNNGTNMAGLFAYTKADTLDLSKLDTSNVTDMSYMFNYVKINNLNMNNWDTSNVTNMSFMFSYFDGSPISFAFDTSNVTNMSNMFSYSTAPVNFINFDGSSLTNVKSMFDGSQSKIENIDKLNFPKLTSLEYMFSGYKGTELDLSSWDISNITSMYYMFSSCQIKKLNLSNWNTSKVTDMRYMFNTYSSYLEELIIPDWDMTNTTSKTAFFPSSTSSTKNLRFIDLSRSNEYTIDLFATTYLPKRTETTYGEIVIPADSSQEVIDAIIAKYWKPVGPLISLNSFKIKPELDEIKPGKTTKMYIYDCVPWYGSKEDIEYVISDPTKLSIDENNVITGLSEGSVTVYARLKSNNSIVSDTFTITVSEVDSTPNVIKFRGTSTPSTNNYMKINGNDVRLSAMSYDTLTGIYTYDVGAPITSIRFNGYGSGLYNNNITELIKINTSNMTDMSNMFDECSSLTSLDLSNFDTSNVTNMSYMFDACSKLTSLDLSNFDTSNVTNMNGMFYTCSKLTSLDLSNFDTSNVTNTQNMFMGCSSLTSLDLSSFDTRQFNTNTVSNMFSLVPSTATITVSNDTWTLTETETYFSGTFNRI